MRHGLLAAALFGILTSATVAFVGSRMRMGLPDPVPLRSAELYDPSTGRFSGTSRMSCSRQGHSATSLKDGRVLVAGGRSPGSGYSDNLLSAELYDPRRRTWERTGALNDGRHGHPSILLGDGRVLVIGGEYPQKGSCELYDVAKGTWSRAASMTTPRDRLAAVLLVDGRVLVTGGFCHPRGGTPVADAEIYDPPKDRWQPVASMTTARAYHSAVVLADGMVLVVGGENGDPAPRDNLATAEVYDPRLDEWEAVASMSVARSYGQTASMLRGGNVLLVGGEPNAADSLEVAALGTTESFDLEKNVWTPAGSLRHGRHFHAAAELSNGRLLVTGGYGTGASRDQRPLDTAEIYDPNDGWREGSKMKTARAWHSATLLANGSVLIAGGIGIESAGPASGADK